MGASARPPPTPAPALLDAPHGASVRLDARPCGSALLQDKRPTIRKQTPYSAENSRESGSALSATPASHSG